VTRAVLAQGKLGQAGLWVMAVVASSPLTVQVGGIPTMYAATGVTGVPLAFVLVGGVLLLLAVAYAGAVGHIRHAAPLYALLGRGVSPVAGVAAGVCALVGYLAIGASLYGLIGPTLAAIAGGGPWWAWSAGALAVVAGLGLLGGMSSARFLGALLTVEVAVIACYVIAALVQRQGPLTWQPFAPSALAVPGMAGAVAFAMAAFVGVETVPAYAEEARGGAPAVRRAMLAAIAFGSLSYAAGAWAMAVHAGLGRLDRVAADAAQGPLQTLTRVFGPGIGLLATGLLATSVIAAMASFHAAGSRYLFAMAREGVLPARLATVGKTGDGGTPVAASLIQTALAALVLAAFTAAGADPLAGMFTWLSTLGAVMLLTLLVAGSWAALRFHASGQGGADSVWVRRIAPVCGSALGAVLITMMLSNLGSLLGLPPGSRRWLAIPALVAATTAVGLIWAIVVRLTKPASIAQVGRIVADPVTSPVARLAKLGL
jgi:amino acid transporter